jgi:enterochelin esterase-like enzyme
MKRLLLIFALACWPCGAQSSPNSQPAISNISGAEYPRVDADLRVEFRVKAPDAHKVQVQIGGTTLDMSKDAQGTWTATSQPQAPGFHYYSIVIDGLAVSDPASKTYFGVGRDFSAVEVPEAGVDFYNVRDVPHGDVRELWYYSKVASSWRRCFVYAPPDYDANIGRRYPVLYLQHGAGEDETGWIRQGHANFILDNLIAAGTAQPMIIVMDRGYAARNGGPVDTLFGPASHPLGSAESLQAMKDMSATFEQVVLNDLIPMIDSRFRTIADRDHRAIAGLSMGAMQAFQIGLNHTDTFSYIGGFSGALAGFVFGGNVLDLKTAFNGVMADPAQFNSRIRLLWLGVGSAEAERFHAGITSFHVALGNAGIKNVFYESPGTAHEWQTWRRDLNDFAPRLFQKPKS